MMVSLVVGNRCPPMSSSTNNGLRSSLQSVPSFSEASEHVLSPIRALAFWIAVALPFLYLPLLAVGLSSRALTGAFLALLLCNAVALLVGHDHLRD